MLARLLHRDNVPRTLPAQHVALTNFADILHLHFRHDRIANTRFDRNVRKE